jgi:putative SOS response-associated peptidase YedK
VKKQPFFIHRADGSRLAMAGIYEIWRDPTRDRDDDDAWLRTCSVITTRATDAAGHVHDRMPMVIRREVIDRWLDPELSDAQAALDLLSVTDADQLEAYAVSTAVGNVRNNDRSLLEPIETDDEPATLI